MDDGEKIAGPSSNAGEIAMRKRLPSRHKIDDEKLSRMVFDYLDASLIGFIEAQPFFFIATSSDVGECDANFRGQNNSASGRPQPLLKIRDNRTIVFPDFAGNGFYNSLGNIHLNPHIGMLFIDFREQQRVRVNGKAFIGAPETRDADIWPEAQAIVHVEVQQAFRNCSRRIPKMKMYANSDKIIRLGRR